ncbi:C-type lectin domain family 10 member A-like [Ruditapes philippinarum]|uniref:C-type lectin domain family 10 member A-like n=1 Tax=Ruditapes philippinarum TaxID=129788 RepID=UPI00295AFFBD|nr:C-type lectin domain family 10 member A-like [Ruditapes philippinarum]
MHKKIIRSYNTIIYSQKMNYLKLCFVYMMFVEGVICGKTTPCEDNWVVFQGSCYLVGHDNLHFIEAERFCEHHNAYLVHVDDAVENTFLKSYLGDLKDGKHWIGLTDGVTEGIWKWSDTDTVATYSNWSPGEPNGGKSANCAVIRSDFHYNWTDDPCSSLYKAVCEKRPVTDTEIVG